ncbi:MAG TPA: nucleoside deaminase [Patescibacteria group bacterium]|nr:nucleoside deaminase [Patescibacteria group bacterium]
MIIRDVLELAIKEAKRALETGDYPFGAVITEKEGNVVTYGHNDNFSANDISAHAEIQCLRKIDIRKLLDEQNEYHIYSSGEPCGGCSFFIARAKAIKRVTWALTDPQKAGFDDLRKNEELSNFFDHIDVKAEPFEDLKEQSASLLRLFYEKLGQFEKMKLY